MNRNGFLRKKINIQMYANKVLNLGFSILVYRNLHSRLQIILFYMYILFYVAQQNRGLTTLFETE